MKKIILLLLQFWIFSFSAISQNWTNYNQTNSGLSNDGVTSISVDNSDAVWIGASNGCAFQYGLNKFDGTNWTHYDHTNSGLVSDAVWRVITDQNNNVWITYYCGGMGLTKFDGTNWITYDTTNSNLPSDLIADLFIDNNGELWLACNGITKFNGTSFINYYSGLPASDFFTTLLIDGNIVYAVGENLGLYVYDTISNSIVIYNPTNSNIPSTCFGTLCKDLNGLLWMGSNYDFNGSTGGIATFDGNTFTAINPFSSTYTWVYYNQSIAIDQTNNIWVSNRCEGLYKYDGTSWTKMGANLPQSGCAGFVYADHNNRIWYGEVYSGVWTNTPTVGIAQQSINESVNLFPNPTNSVITVHLYNNTNIKVFNVLGKIEIEKDFTFIPNRKVDLDVSFLSAGIYFIKAGNEVRKFIKK